MSAVFTRLAAAALLCTATACGAGAASHVAAPASTPASTSTSASTPAAAPTGSSPTATPASAASPSSPIVVEGNKIQYHGTRTVTGMSSTTVQLSDFYFSPSVLIGSPGQRLTVHLDNVGQVAHTFTISSEHVNAVLSAGQRATVTVTFPQQGRLPFICQYHIGAGMAGVLEAA